MKRTWKDAACEVGWNAAKEYSSRYGMLNGFHFLAGIKGEERFAIFSGSHTIGRHESLDYDSFSSFRAAFMKWLDDNERRLG